MLPLSLCPFHRKAYNTKRHCENYIRMCNNYYNRNDENGTVSSKYSVQN